VLLTGIEAVATRGDLLDRSLLIEMPDLPEGKRCPEDEFWRAFAAVRSRILGALLDAVRAALHHLPTVRLHALPRVADFAICVNAAAPALGWDEQDFLDAYARNREEAHAVAVDSSAVAHAVHRVACTAKFWEGTTTDLLAALTAQGVQGRERLQGLPRNARTISEALRRLAPNLRVLGTTIRCTRAGDKLRTRRIAIQSEASGAS